MWGLTILMFLASVSIQEIRAQTSCYDELGQPQISYHQEKRCFPGFVNAALNRVVQVTSVSSADHPPSHLTDSDDQTYWQLEKGSSPNVNLTLNLGKSFDVTYVRLKFISKAPDNFAIYKQTTKGGPWIPWQFFSSDCSRVYGRPDRSYAEFGEEDRGLCTSKERLETVAFITLEGRPSAYDFENKADLQEWVTAREVMISFLEGSSSIAILDFAVGGRCKCNGHASECVNVDGHNGDLVCKCSHNTGGPDCGECRPFCNDMPWTRASLTDAGECQTCNCSGFSDRCFFDPALYASTGHGGRCVDCRGNRDGAHCEKCKRGYCQEPDDAICTPCSSAEENIRGGSSYFSYDLLGAFVKSMLNLLQ